jgi:hypothetical protein
MLRHIRDEFNIGSELRAMTFILFMSDLAYISCIIFAQNTIFVSLGFLEYIEVFLSVSLLYVTGIRPLMKTYD